MNTKPLVPTVHLNGTDGASLMACYLEARQAVDFAMEALKATAPHGRDYYVQPDKGALSRATAEYMARMAALETVDRKSVV